VLAPDPARAYESAGFRNDVVFPAAALLADGAPGSQEVWLYYGAADSVVALAVAPLDEVLAFLSPVSGPAGGASARG
jgi:beta-1,4-mannooligosaccharide/beta-1,4-mannosyl-N-acetylglucosamine phosphorylase